MSTFKLQVLSGTTWKWLRGTSTGAANVAVESIVPGVAATSLGKAEDAAHTSGDVGVMALGVNNELFATFSATSLDYVPIAVDKYGRVFVGLVSSIVPGSAATNLGKAEDAAHTTGDVGVLNLAVSAATPTATAGTAGDYQPPCVSSEDGVTFTAALAHGAALTLKASGAETTSTNGTGVACKRYKRLAILFDVTVADTDAGDTLDVYIDVLGPDGTTWLNAVHFNQIVGTDSAVKHWAVLDPTAAGTATFDVTTDAAEEAVRPYLFGSQIRYRSVIVDSGTDDASFTYAVTAYGQ